MCWGTLAMCGVMIWALTETLLGHPGYVLGHPGYVHL